MSKPRTRHRFRKLHGILLLDKASGPSSNQALQQARHLFRAEKGGLTGSLDPLATGVITLTGVAAALTVALRDDFGSAGVVMALSVLAAFVSQMLRP